ncbi:hypothetical protein SprV_0100502200 [Sparganum proliferum]
MMARATDNETVSDAFAATNGVKQGCALAPTLFSHMFSAMLMNAYRDERPEIHIAYRTDCHLLNHLRVSTATVHELLFADYCVLNATSKEDMQRSMNLFSAACENFGLVINTGKTVVMHQPLPNTAPPHNAPLNSVNGTQLQMVDNFPYLGSTFSCSTKIDDDVARWISKPTNSDGFPEPPLSSSPSPCPSSSSSSSFSSFSSYLSSSSSAAQRLPLWRLPRTLALHAIRTQ